MLTKPGYGTFTEAACAGVPVLYVARRDWPEEPHLVQWLQQNGICLEVERTVLEAGELDVLLKQLWAMPYPSAPIPAGATEAAQYLCDLLESAEYLGCKSLDFIRQKK